MLLHILRSPYNEIVAFAIAYNPGEWKGGGVSEPGFGQLLTSPFLKQWRWYAIVRENMAQLGILATSSLFEKFLSSRLQRLPVLHGEPDAHQGIGWQAVADASTHSSFTMPDSHRINALLADDLLAGIRSSLVWNHEKGRGQRSTEAVQVLVPTEPGRDFMLKIYVGFEKGWTIFEGLGLGFANVEFSGSTTTTQPAPSLLAHE